jgi:outer membrane protein assembly factor BamB
MARFWGVLWGALGIWGYVLADTSNSAPRTPNGMLWAGTTFQLRATATVNNQFTVLSSDAQVRVGQVIQWQWEVVSPFGQSADQRSNADPNAREAFFIVRLLNDGNGWDRLGFGLTRMEYAEQPVWGMELRENTLSAWQGSRALPDGLGSLIAPGENMFYLLRLTPPGSSTPTDGAWAALTASTSNGSTQQTLGEFTAGALRYAWINARAWCHGNQVQHVAPVLYQGRLIWMGTDATSNDTLIFLSRDPVENTQGGGIGNERLVYGRTLRGFVPNGFSVLLGAGWFMGRGNQLVRIDLQRVVNNNTSSDPFSVVQFPAGVSPRLDLEPLVFNGRLYVAGSDGRLYAFREDGVRTGQGAPAPATYGAFTTNLVCIGRAFYIGTANGWVLQFDALTGSVRAARRVATQRIHSLAPTPFGRQLLARAGERTILCLNPNQLNAMWQRTLDEDIVSPITASPQSEVGAVVTRSGQLLAFLARSGVNLPYYPQRVFGNETLARATVGFARRVDRRATYVYVLAQRDTGSTTQHQALFCTVTLENPFNRLEYTEASLHTGSDYLPTILFTGNRNTSYCLIASRRAESNWGTVAAIPLR